MTLDNKPVVTILTLTYNRAHFLSEAISSVLSQSYANWELVVLDDGSKDNTAEIITSFNDARIKYIKREKNIGLFLNRQKSLDHVTGKYVAILDSDDYWCRTDKLSEQVAFLEKNSDHVLIGTQIKTIDNQGNFIENYNYSTTDTNIRKKILIQNQFTHSAVMMRSEVVAKTKGYQPTLAEDLDLFLQLGVFGKMANLDMVATAHRVHDASENDHGIKMSTAVKNIVSKYHKNYPGAFLGILASNLRVLKYRLLNLINR